MARNIKPPTPGTVTRYATKDLIEWLAAIAYHSGDWGFIKEELLRRVRRCERATKKRA